MWSIEKIDVHCQDLSIHAAGFVLGAGDVMLVKEAGEVDSFPYRGSLL